MREFSTLVKWQCSRRGMVRLAQENIIKHPITSTFILSLQESLSHGPLVLLQYDVDPIDVQDFV
jgi:hypothetical protein